MIQYNIYKELYTGEKVLIQTVTDIRKITFKADETGDIKYVITKIDERGESEETIGNGIIILCKPQIPSIIENPVATQLQLTPSNFTPNLLVEKSYDNIYWQQIYKGTDTLITLDKETKQTFYRYFTYTEYSISKPSDIVLYDPIDLPDINLNTQQISKTKFLLTWDNFYYLKYVIKINNNETVLTNESNSIELDITDEVMYIKVHAYKGMKEMLFNTFFISQTKPSEPTNLIIKTNDTTVQLDWDKEPNTNYTLYIDDELIFENKNIVDSYIFKKDYGTYNVKLYTVNFMGQSETYATGTIKIIEQPKLFRLINTVNSNHITQVQVELLDNIPDTYDIKFYNSNYLVSRYDYKLLINNGTIIPKYLVNGFSKIRYIDTTEYNSTYISKFSEVFRYIKPRPIQPELQYIRVGETQFNINTYLFTWTTDNSNMAYSIYKNGILMERFDKNTNNYTMSCLEGDIICVHSYIGYEESESNTVTIGKTISNIIKPYNININYIVGKNISLECNNSFIEDYDFTLLLYKEINNTKVLIGSFYDTSTIDFKEDNYGLNTYYIQYQDKFNQKSDYSNPINIEILEKPSNITFLDAYNQINIELSEVPKATSYQLYYFNGNDWLPLDIPITETLYSLPDIFNNIDIKLKYKAIVDGLGYLYTSEISEEFAYTKSDIAFTATVNQVNLLPLYGNKIQINIQEVVDKELPLYFDIKITKDNSKEIILNKLKYQTYDDIFMFGNTFGLPFGDTVNNKYFPLTIDLEELCNATIEITGYKGISKHTVTLDYEYIKVPQQVQLVKVKADYQDDRYEYNFEWLLDNNTTQQYYCIENKDTGEIYNKIDTNIFSLTSDKHINNFTIYSYNISGRTNEIVIFTPFIDRTTATIIKLNKEVKIDIKPIDYTKKYVLYIDNNVYMESEVPRFNLDKFTGTKDVTIRCTYINGVYTIHGKPYTFTYTPDIIEGTYEILKHTLENSIRVQLRNDTIDEDTRYINICIVDNKNNTIIIKTLDIPIDDFKFVLELTNEEIKSINSIYFELVNGWEVNRTNIIELQSGYFRFGDTDGNFSHPFLH